MFFFTNYKPRTADFPVMSSVSQLRPKLTAKSRGVRERGDKKLFLLQIVRYKVASVNKTVQTYQQGNPLTRHVKSWQTKPMSIISIVINILEYAIFLPGWFVAFFTEESLMSNKVQLVPVNIWPMTYDIVIHNTHTQSYPTPKKSIPSPYPTRSWKALQWRSFPSRMNIWPLATRLQLAEFEKKAIVGPYISHLSPVRNWIFNMIFCLTAQIVFSFKFIPLGISQIIILIWFCRNIVTLHWISLRPNLDRKFNINPLSMNWKLGRKRHHKNCKWSLMSLFISSVRSSSVHHGLV